MSWYVSFYSVKLEQEIMRLPPALVARYVQYVKKSEKTPRKELDIARKRMREVKTERSGR